MNPLPLGKNRWKGYILINFLKSDYHLSKK